MHRATNIFRSIFSFGTRKKKWTRKKKTLNEEFPCSKISNGEIPRSRFSLFKKSGTRNFLVHNVKNLVQNVEIPRSRFSEPRGKPCSERGKPRSQQNWPNPDLIRPNLTYSGPNPWVKQCSESVGDFRWSFRAIENNLIHQNSRFFVPLQPYNCI